MLYSLFFSLLFFVSPTILAMQNFEQQVGYNCLEDYQEVKPGIFLPPVFEADPRVPFDPEKRPTSDPYPSPDTFRAFCDVIIDETCLPLEPKKVEDGSTIFLKPEWLPFFQTVVDPLLKAHYILVTVGDYPEPGAFKDLLDNEKLIAWFAYGVEKKYSGHPKMVALPQGIAPQFLDYGNVEIIEECKKDSPKEKEHLLYMNFKVPEGHPHGSTSYGKYRKLVFELFKDKDFCTVASRKSHKDFLSEMSNFKFVLAPIGNTCDSDGIGVSYRVWEALLMGCRPIVEQSTVPKSLVEDLPVLLVDSWQEVTEKFLEQKWEEMAQKKYNYDKLNAQYWFDEIRKVRKEFLEKNQV